MKKPHIYSAILGGTFFAIPYLALGVEVIPATLLGISAFGAGMLVFRNIGNSKITYELQEEADIIKKSKENTIRLKEISKLVEDENLIKNVNTIYETSNKIIKAIESKPTKISGARNFLNYYLPVTIKILERYDEIENQKLTTNDSKRFMNSIENMVEKIKSAFEIQLNNIYQPEMIDTDAEIKVFEAMLKSDGFLEDINIDKSAENKNM